jgi:16S rRNA (guanine1207-N2)-methyltransferase
MTQEQFTFHGHDLDFTTQPGVFAQYGLDFGSKQLLHHIEVPPDGSTILDLGCGCGLLGLSLASALPASQVYLVDSDIRAIRLTRANAKGNKLKNLTITISDGISDLPPDLQFDLVISNPPTHQGREVLVQFLTQAHQVLKSGGQFWVVVNRMNSVIKHLSDIFTQTDKIAKKQGYIVCKAVK